MKRLVVFGALAASACFSVGPDENRVSVTGTLTYLGQPVTSGQAVISLGSTRLETLLVFAVANPTDGRYAIEAAVGAPDCPLLFVQVALLNAVGVTLGAAREDVGGCGDRVVDLVLEP